MKTELLGKPVSPATASPGCLMALDDSGTAWGIRCQAKEGGRLLELVFVLAPKDHRSRFSFLTMDAIGRTAFAVSDVVLIPDMTTIHIGFPEHPELGTVLANDNSVFWVGKPGSGGSRVFVNTVTGLVERSLSEGTNFVWFSGWRISYKLADEYLDILKFNAAA